MRRGDDAVGDRGLKVDGQEEGIAHGEDPIAGAEQVAVAQFDVGEIVAAEELDQGHVAGRIEAHEDGVVDAAVGQAALHRVAAGLGDVEIGQGIAVGGDQRAGAAPLPSAGEDRRDRRLHAGDHGDPPRLGLEHRRGRLRRGSLKRRRFRRLRRGGRQN